MARWTFLAAVMLCAFSSGLSAAGAAPDAVYLKNGSVVRGTILEQVDDVSVKIETPEHDVFVFRIDRVDRIVDRDGPGVTSEDGDAAPAEEAERAAPAGGDDQRTKAAEADQAADAHQAAADAHQAAADAHQAAAADAHQAAAADAHQAAAAEAAREADADAREAQEEARQDAEEAREEAAQARDEARDEAAAPPPPPPTWQIEGEPGDDGSSHFSITVPGPLLVPVPPIPPIPPIPPVLPFAPVPPVVVPPSDFAPSPEIAHEDDPGQEADDEAREADEEARDAEEEAREAAEEARKAREEALEEARKIREEEREAREQAREDAREAREAAREQQREAQEQVRQAAEPPGRKLPGLALGLALGVPIHTSILGVGQFYNGQVARGFAYAGGGVAFMGMIGVGASQGERGRQLVAAGAVGYLTLYVVSSIDAYRTARRINRERGYLSSRIKPTFMVSVDGPRNRDVNVSLGAGLTF
jgi:hypothetical protein